MAKYRKIIEAGPLVVETIYPAPNPRDTPEMRAGKKKLSSEAQQRMNFKYAWQKLRLLLAANFVRRDLWITLTCDDEYLPKNRNEAQRLIKSFFRRLRRVRERRGCSLRYVYTIEHKHGDGRWHFHVVMNATGNDYKEIVSLWGAAQNIEIQNLRIDKEKNFRTLAMYMCKEQRDSVGQRLWSGSKNLIRPKPECMRVPDDETICVPRGATTLEESRVRTQYGVFQYIEYLVPGWERGVKASRPRRRRKK